MKFHEVINRLVKLYGARIAFSNIGCLHYGDVMFAVFVIENWEEFRLEVFPDNTFDLRSKEQRNADRVKAQIEGLKRDEFGNMVKAMPEDLKHQQNQNVWNPKEASVEKLNKFKNQYLGKFDRSVISRTANLHPDYEMREVDTHGIGKFPVNKLTGEVCDCKMQWNENGTILSCPVCGLDGT